VESSRGARPRRIVAIGNFDGVHRGHQAVLSDVVRDAERRDLTPLVLTFSPHPAAVLGRVPPPLLTTIPRKLELFARISPAIEVKIQRFDLEFAALSPEKFVESVLCEELGAEVVVVGGNFRFGKGRAGNFDTLRDLGKAHGFETRSHELVSDEQGAFSSTRIRQAIARGDVHEAAAMLSRPHMLSGVVVHGAQRGRTIGFPTCNLGEVEEMLPPWGVYAVLVDREGPGSARALAKGVANIGVRPTVETGEARPSIEAHLFDLDEDLYGARLRLHLIARLRGEEKFASFDALKAQIVRDASEARSLLANAEPDPAAHGAFR